jgi:flagellar protein FliS
MTISLARSRYRQAEAVGQPKVDDPHEVIAVTLRELERSLGVLSAAREQGRKTPEEHSTRALTAIYILQSSLDMEKGEDIAELLMQLYEFTRQQVLKLMRKEEDALIDDARNAISDILEAWRGIGPEAKRMPS